METGYDLVRIYVALSETEDGAEPENFLSQANWQKKTDILQAALQ